MWKPWKFYQLESLVKLLISRLSTILLEKAEIGNMARIKCFFRDTTKTITRLNSYKDSKKAACLLKTNWIIYLLILDDQAQFTEFVKKSNSAEQAKKNRNVISLPSCKSSRTREVKVPLKYRDLEDDEQTSSTPSKQQQLLSKVHIIYQKHKYIAPTC